MRLTKKLATLAIVSIGSLLATRASSPSACASAYRNVAVEAEQQGDVDADPVFDQLAHRGHAGRGAGHLDHQIGAIDHAMQPSRLGDRLVGLVGEVGRHFEADIAVPGVEPVVDRPQRIARRLDVRDGERLIAVHDRRVGIIADEFGELGIIGLALAHRLLEDRRIGGDAGDAILLHQPLQAALIEKGPIDEIEPGRLSRLLELLQEAGHTSQAFPISSLATFTTLSTVKPNFCCSAENGAEAPKVDIAIVRPLRPT
jgi:hypothetical protein